MGAARRSRVSPPFPADGAEHGYGLVLVDALADRWGSICSPEGRVTWCRISWSEAAAPCPAN